MHSSTLLLTESVCLKWILRTGSFRYSGHNSIFSAQLVDLGWISGKRFLLGTSSRVDWALLLLWATLAIEVDEANSSPAA